MEAPKIPTDNLYKFMAIIGAIFLGVGFVAPDLYRFDLLKKRQEIMKANAELLADGRLIIEAINRTQTSLDEKNKYIVELNKRIETYGCKSGDFDLCDHWKTARNELNAEKENLNKFKDAATKWSSSAEKVKLDSFGPEFLEERVKKVDSIATWFFWGGAIVSIAGFVLWYFKLQKYQDRALKNTVTIPIPPATSSEEQADES